MKRRRGSLRSRNFLWAVPAKTSTSSDFGCRPPGHDVGLRGDSGETTASSPKRFVALIQSLESLTTSQPFRCGAVRARRRSRRNSNESDKVPEDQGSHDSRWSNLNRFPMRQSHQNRASPVRHRRRICFPLRPGQIVAFLPPAIGTMRPLRIAYSTEPHRMRFEPKLASQTTK